jgi:hypothetical protein
MGGKCNIITLHLHCGRQDSDLAYGRSGSDSVIRRWLLNVRLARKRTKAARFMSARPARRIENLTARPGPSHFAGTFDTSNLASMNNASSSALLTLITSAFARIGLQARCQCGRSSRRLPMEVM